MSELIRNVLEPVVTTRTAVLPNAQLADREIDVVDDHEQVAWFEPVMCQQRPDRASASIHERQGLGESDRKSPNASPSEHDVPFCVLQQDVELVGQSVDHGETDIVARSFVFGPGITETDDKALRFRHRWKVGKAA